MPDRRALIRAGGVVAAAAAVAGAARPAEAAATAEGYLRLSVKDFGALGDNVTEARPNRKPLPRQGFGGGNDPRRDQA